MAARRRFSERLLLLANVTVANVVAALWVVGFLQPHALGVDVGDAADGARVLGVPLQNVTAWLALLAAVGLLLWNFAWLVRRRDEGAPSNWLVSAGPGGPVRVAREAVEAGIRAAGEALPEVTRLRVQLDLSQPKRLQVVGQYQCAEGQDHHGASRRLREVFRRRFGELIRLADGVRVDFDLEFQGFAGKLAKHAAEAPPPEEASSDEPFRGPQYPIDGEDER